MKSIKDKAEEKYPIITGESQTYNEKFVEGANYVLDETEECFNPKDDMVAQWVAIATLVEQLKGNQ